MTLHNCYTFNLNPPVDALLKVNNKKHKKAVVLDSVYIVHTCGICEKGTACHFAKMAC